MAQAPSRKYECTLPHCGKVFNRKEHLTRHLKSHDPEPQYQCPICGRRYARSDVLKRHVEFHPQFPSARQNARPNPGTSTEAGSTLGPGGSDAVRPEPSLADSQNAAPLENIASMMNLDTSMSPVDPETRQTQAWLQPQAPWAGPFNIPGFTMDASSQSPWGPGANSSAEGLLASTPTNSSIQPSLTEPNIHPLRPLGPGPTITTGVRSSSSSTSTAAAMSSPVTPGASALLRPLLNRCSPKTRRLIELYFEDVHPYWPILHAPTFDMDAICDLLLSSMVMLSSWLHDGPEHVELAPVVFNEVMAAHLHLSASLNTLQALLLCTIYCTSCLEIDGMRMRALQLSGILFSACRYLDVFSGQQDSPDVPVDDSAFAHWLAEEQLHRVAYGALRIDAFISILTDHPASIRFQEITIPLPKTPSLWTAATEEERRKLQWSEPAGRERAPFCFLMRDALEIGRDPELPYRLGLEDYHLGLVALQSGIWETAREAHSFAADGLATKLVPGGPVKVWYTHSTLWRTEVEREHGMGKAYWTSPPGSRQYSIVPLTLTLWHAAMLKIHAPIRLIRTPANYLNRGTHDGLSTQHPRSKLRTWMSASCCRSGVWHGAQLGRILEHESGANAVPSMRLKINPLIVPATLMGAVVVCFYAYQIRSCPACTGVPMRTEIDLFAAEQGDKHLDHWLETGEGLALWSPARLLVCQCNVQCIADWFRRLLAKDETARGEFEAFLAELSRGLPGRG